MLDFSVDGRVAHLHFDDGKANAVGFDYIAAMNDGLDRASEEAGAVVISGMPGRFSAGFDLSVLRDGGPEAASKLVNAGGAMILRLFTHPQPVVVACTGHALAAGAIILMAADTRIGADGDFKIGLNETAIGMALPVFGIELAKARLSKRHLTAAFTQARIYDPSGARDAGFLDEVVGPDQVVGRAAALAAQLAELPADAYAANKDAIRRDVAATIGSSLEG